MHFAQAQAPRNEALAVAKELVHRLHDECEERQHLAVESFRLVRSRRIAAEPPHTCTSASHASAPGIMPPLARRLSGSSSPARPFSTASAPPVSSIVRRTSIAEPSILSTRKFDGCARARRSPRRRADADVFGSVLDARRNLRRVDHAAEKARKLALADSGDARRLQDHARGAGALGLAHEGDLLLGGLAEYRDRERPRVAAAAASSSAERSSGASLPTSVARPSTAIPGACAKACFDLHAESFEIQASVGAKERVLHRHDAAHHFASNSCSSALLDMSKPPLPMAASCAAQNAGTSRCRPISSCTRADAAAIALRPSSSERERAAALAPCSARRRAAPSLQRSARSSSAVLRCR